jgi:hypothetical protein
MSSLLSLGVGAIVEAVGKVASDLVTTEKERGEIALENRKLDQAGDMAQVEVNKVEAASPSMFVAGWRPFAGWVCGAGLAYQFLVRPILPWLVTSLGGSAPEMPSVDNDALMTLLLGMLGLGTLRTAERLRGKA